MKQVSRILSIVAFSAALTFIQAPALACDHDGHCKDTHGHVDAPAPLIGASLPGLAIGYGVFCLIRHRVRRRKIGRAS